MFLITATPINLGEFAPKTPGGYQAMDAASGLSRIVSGLLGIITAIAGLSFLFYFMFGAITWITSGGDPQKAQTAKTALSNALIGLVITVAAYPLALLVSRLLGVPLAEPQELFNSFF